MRTKSIRTTILAVVATSTLIAASHSGATVFRTYLSSTGNDAGACTLPAPCRLLPAALAAVVNGGEIWMLDSANYNVTTFVIDKSVTILAVPGAVGSVVANNADAVQINAAGARVTLKNLGFVNLAGAGNNGVNFIQGASLTIIGSSFAGLTGTGVTVASAGARGLISDSFFSANTIGMKVTNGLVSLLDNSFTGNTIAIEASGNGGAGSNPVNGTTRVRVSKGNISDNATAYHMDNTGLRQSGTCNGSNIFLRSPSADIHNVGNSTIVSVTGSSDLNSGCSPGQFTIDSYSAPSP